MKNTVENNLRKWDEKHDWREGGDEWKGQAKFSRQPYDKWKSSLVETFIAPNANPDSVVLEIAPGHGRWSAELVDRCAQLILVDLSPNCIETCKERFESYEHVRYIVNDGRSLPGVDDGSIDFVWSFAAFVHIDPETIGAYFKEIERVLKPGSTAIIHHAGRRHGTLWLRFLRGWGKRGNKIYKKLSMPRPYDRKLRAREKGASDGWRSDVSRRLARRKALDAGLEVEDQLRFWGKKKKFGVPRYGDWITVLRKR